jgi:hypothetical protein
MKAMAIIVCGTVLLALGLLISAHLKQPKSPPPESSQQVQSANPQNH